MASHHIITSIFFIIFTSLSLLGASSSHVHGHTEFLDCLTDQFERSNSATDHDIYTPKILNETYAALIRAQNLRLAYSPQRPDLIVTPFHVSEIQAAIFCSKKLNLLIRVRSGGHDYEGLSYTPAAPFSATPFVIVDLRNFRSVKIDDDEKTAWVEVGATLGQLYYTLSRKSKTLAFSAGVCPTVGVGGHFSGGGYGMMSRKHSIASDHVIDARLINADGKILDRKGMGEDLFWAIRGGGGTSFGIVLEFKVTLVTVPELITVFNVTRTLGENATEIVNKWQYIADKIDENLLMRLFLTPVKSQTTGKLTVAASFTSLYLGRVKDLLPLMQKEFPELGLVKKDCTEMNFVESTLFFAGLNDPTHEILRSRIPTGWSAPFFFKGKSDFLSSPIPVKGLREIWRFLVEKEKFQLELSPYGGAMNALSDSDTAFPHRRGNIFMIHYGLGWIGKNESQASMDWYNRFYAFMGRYVTKSPRAAYINYRDLDIGRNTGGNTTYAQASVWGLRYFKNNFKRLVAIKTKVDPLNVFRNEQSIPPLIK